MKITKKTAVKRPSSPRPQGTGAKYKPLSGTPKPREVKIGKTKAKMVGGIMAVPTKPKRQVF